MGSPDDSAVLLLAEGDLQAGDGDEVGVDEILENVARADGGKLVGVAHEQEVGLRRNGSEKGGGEANVEHAGLVHYHEVACERLVLVVDETSRGRIEL